MKNSTSLMYKELESKVDKKLLNKFSIFSNVSQANFNKKTIYWSHIPPHKEPVNFFKDLGYSKRIDHYVFTSYWQANIATHTLEIPEDKVTVIKNATTAGDLELKRENDKIKVCYTSSPFAGLDILLDAWKLVKDKNCELHIYPDTNSYPELIKKCKEIPGVKYRANISHDEQIKQLTNFDILAHPATYDEPCSTSIIEAISTGLRVITSATAAMPEITEGWANLYPIYRNKETHANVVAELLDQEIEACRDGVYKEQSELQREVYAPAWNWDERTYQWEDLLSSL